MSTDTLTAADIQAKIDEAVAGLKSKNDELIADNKKLKTDLRRVQDITPEMLAAVEAERDKALTDLAAAQKQAKDAAKVAETATKALETEQGAARSYALEAELASAIAEGNVVPGLVPGFKAMMMTQAKADLIDGKYSVQIGDKAAREHIKAFLDSDDGKAWRAAAANGGGGATGGGGKGEAGKSISAAEFNALGPKDRAARMSEGYVIGD